MKSKICILVSVLFLTITLKAQAQDTPKYLVAGGPVKVNWEDAGEAARYSYMKISYLNVDITEKNGNELIHKLLQEKDDGHSWGSNEYENISACDLELGKAKLSCSFWIDADEDTEKPYLKLYYIEKIQFYEQALNKVTTDFVFDPIDSNTVFTKIGDNTFKSSQKVTYNGKSEEITYTCNSDGCLVKVGPYIFRQSQYGSLSVRYYVTGLSKNREFNLDFMYEFRIESEIKR